MQAVFLKKSETFQVSISADSYRTQSIGLLYRFLCRLAQEIERLPNEKNIKAIHQARVATRRLRMALMVLSGVLKPSAHRQWKKTVSSIGQTLGEIRDIDVQIQTLSAVLPTASSPAQPGLQRLIWRLKTKREISRSCVQKLYKSLTKDKWFAQAKSHLKQAAHPDFHPDTPAPSKIILDKIHAVLDYHPLLTQAHVIEAEVLHTLRKIVRNLRYTLEIMDILSNHTSSFKAELRILKSLQDTLGSIHDCDIWIEYLPSFLKKEQQKILQFSGNVDDVHHIETGFRWFANNRQILRNKQYDLFMVQWNQLQKSGFWEVLIDKSRLYSHLSTNNPPQLAKDSLSSHHTDV